MVDETLILEIKKEALRIEECCEYSSKAHYNDCEKWNKRHYRISIPITAIATIMVFVPDPLVKNVLAIFTAVLAAVQTVVKPQINQQVHKIAGDSYSQLRNKVRRFRTIDIPQRDIQKLSEEIKIYGDMLDNYNAVNPPPSRKAYEKAKIGINCGETEFKVDTKEI